MESSRPDFVIREFRQSDAVALLDLFRDTVRRVNSRDYSTDQVQAWASDEIDPADWAARFEGHIAFVATCPEGPVGFVDMTATGHIDRLFVSAAHQRRGIANLLLERITSVARAKSLARLTVESSITAKPFFLANHFSVTQEQTVECRGQQFVNFKMEKTLS